MCCVPLPLCASLSSNSAAWSRLRPFFSTISRFSSPTLMYGPSKATVSLVVVLLKRQATREAIGERVCLACVNPKKTAERTGEDN